MLIRLFLCAYPGFFKKYGMIKMGVIMIFAAWKTKNVGILVFVLFLSTGFFIKSLLFLSSLVFINGC